MGEKVRKRYGRGEGTNFEPTAGIQVQNDKITLPCPHPHAYSYVGFSTPCVISIWKMFFLPLQRVTVLMIITNIYVSDTSTLFTGHKWCNPQNSPVRKVLSLSPFYREKKGTKQSQSKWVAETCLSLFLTNLLSLLSSVTSFFG